MQTFMKKKFLLPLIFFLLSCNHQDKKEDKETHNIKSKEIVSPPNKVYIDFLDSSKSFSTNIRLNEFQDKPDLLGFGKNAGRNSITIPTEQNIEILGGNFSAGFSYKLDLKKGDSLKIELEKINLNEKYSIEIPIFTIPNSSEKFSELNFGNLLYMENLRSGALEIDSTQPFLVTHWNSKKIYNDATTLLEKLDIENKISKEFFDSEKNIQKFKYLQRELRENNPTIVDSANNLIIGRNRLSLRNDNFLKYPSYIMLLRKFLDRKYFIEKRTLNSKKFDFINDNKTFLSDKEKIAVLDSYLRSIYFLEKETFPLYEEKFQKLSNDSLKNKWNNVLIRFKHNRKKLTASNKDIAILINQSNDNEFVSFP